jgi:hypothetical protein
LKPDLEKANAALGKVLFKSVQADLAIKEINVAL